MIEQLTKRSARLCASSLLAINSVKSLVHKDAESRVDIRPFGKLHAKGRVEGKVHHKGTEVERQGQQSQQVWCHSQRHKTNETFPKWLHQLVKDRILAWPVLVLQ